MSFAYPRIAGDDDGRGRCDGTGLCVRPLMVTDPHHEHDFGSLDVDGHTVFFKIDYYEKGSNYTLGAEHPEDTSTADRVLTIMLACEY